MDENNQVDINQAKVLIRREFGDIGIWDEMHKAAEELEKRTSAYSRAIIAGDMQDIIDLVLSVETGLARVLTLADVIQLAPQPPLMSAMWNDYLKKAVDRRNAKTMPPTPDGQEEGDGDDER